MEVIKLSEGVGKCAIRAAGVLRQGGVVIYPTDTLYGIGVDAFANDAVDRLYEIKGREPGKPMHCIVADLAMAEEYAEVNGAARTLAERFLPGALTLILKKRPAVTTGIGRGMDTIGIRIPKNDLCLEMARTFGKPITTPSANKAGQTASTPMDIVAQFGVENIDLFIDAGILPQSKPSTIVNLVSGHPSVLREGAISAADIVV
jgi:L-threonylcarbamoyladenylate synthase